jgi:HEPN domain-containing protein
LKHVKVHLDEISASYVLNKQTSRLVDKFDETEPGQMATHCVSLYNNIMTEFYQHIYFQIRGDDKKLFEENSNTMPFGEIVNNTFPEATDDIRAAARCLALSEANASVFHSMRVLEHGLRAFAYEVGLQNVELENWKNIIDQIESKIREQEKLPRSPDKSERLRHFGAAAIQFRYFKDAWRNHSMHSRAWYDDDTAKSIFGHVRQFMIEMTTTHS